MFREFYLKNFILQRGTLLFDEVNDVVAMKDLFQILSNLHELSALFELQLTVEPTFYHHVQQDGWMDGWMDIYPNTLVKRPFLSRR